jgi:hypothetical protein
MKYKVKLTEAEMELTSEEETVTYKRCDRLVVATRGWSRGGSATDVSVNYTRPALAGLFLLRSHCQCGDNVTGRFR